MRVFQNSDPNEWGSQPGSSFRLSPWLVLVGFVGLCLLVGVTAGVATTPNVQLWYHSLNRPPLTPPDWLFPPAWGVMYTLMAVAAWLVWRRVGPGPQLRLWGWQLAANAVWSPLFFTLHILWLAAIESLVLAALVAGTTRAFTRVNRTAGWLMTPYAVWVCFAAYLSIGFWWLNPA